MLEVESVEVLHLLGQYFLGYFICPEQVCREKGWSEAAPGAERPCPPVYIKPYLMEKVNVLWYGKVAEHSTETS